MDATTEAAKMILDFTINGVACWGPEEVFRNVKREDVCRMNGDATGNSAYLSGRRDNSSTISDDDNTGAAQNDSHAGPTIKMKIDSEGYPARYPKSKRHS